MAKILITMPDDFLNRVDGVASTQKRTRSELIRAALNTYMRKSVQNPQKASDDAQTLEGMLG